MKRLRHLNILPPTLLLGLTALLSRFMGIARDHLLARTFGATAGTGIYNLDTYYAAFRVPDMLYNLLIFGAISAAFIPIFTRYKKEGQFDEAWKFASSMLHLMMIVILIVAGVAYLFAPQLTHLVAGGFDGEAFRLTTRLMRIMLISPILFTMTSVLVSIQDSFKTFFWRSIGPLFYNGGIIFGILYFGERFGVVGVTWGVIVGALAQLLVQLPALREVEYRHVWMFGYFRQDVRKAFKLIVPRILGLSLTQLTLIVNTFIASFLITGSITIFYLSDNLQALPLGIIAISFAITSFATLSELAAEKTTVPFATEISRVIHQVLFLIIPATIGMIVLRTEIIDVILRSGKFSAGDARLTGTVLSLLLISLFAQSLIPILSRGFYAYHNTKTPVLTALSGAVVSVGGSVLLALILNYGIAGIAAAYSAGNILNFALLYFFMNRKVRVDVLDWVKILKMVVASLLMGVAVAFSRQWIIFEGALLQKVTFLLVMIGVGAVAYFLLAHLFNIPEREMVGRWVGRVK